MPEDNMASFQSVFDRCFGEIYSYVAYRLAPDCDAAQDVTQEVFLAAFERWNSYRGDGTVLSWLRGIARRKVADHLRAKIRGHCPLEMQIHADSAAASQPGHEERWLLLAQVMRSLPEDYVELLEEKYMEGLSVLQIAQKWDKTEKSVESALSRARNMLRNNFQRLQDQERR